MLLIANVDYDAMLTLLRVICSCCAGQVMIQRVNGSLAVSRALGDFDYKSNQTMGPCEQLVSPEPEVCVVLSMLLSER